MKSLIKNQLSFAIDKLPPEQAAIDKEVARLKLVRLSCIITMGCVYIALAILALNVDSHPIFGTLAVIFGIPIAIFGGLFSARNDKSAFENEVNKLAPLTPEQFSKQYYDLSVMGDRYMRVRDYLIALSKLGRAPVLLEYDMLKHWVDEEPVRCRLFDANMTFDQIHAEANRSVNTYDAGGQLRPLR